MIWDRNVARQMGVYTALMDMFGEFEPMAICTCGCELDDHVGVRRNGGVWRCPCKGCLCGDFEDAPDCMCGECTRAKFKEGRS